MFQNVGENCVWKLKEMKHFNVFTHSQETTYTYTSSAVPIFWNIGCKRCYVPQSQSCNSIFKKKKKLTFYTFFLYHFCPHLCLTLEIVDTIYVNIWMLNFFYFFYIKRKFRKLECISINLRQRNRFPMILSIIRLYFPLRFFESITFPIASSKLI